MTTRRIDLDPAPHQHVMRLVAVHLEDGFTIREFGCQSCPAVWFS